MSRHYNEKFPTHYDLNNDQKVLKSVSTDFRTFWFKQTFLIPHQSESEAEKTPYE